MNAAILPGSSLYRATVRREKVVIEKATVRTVTHSHVVLDLAPSRLVLIPGRGFGGSQATYGTDGYGTEQCPVNHLGQWKLNEKDALASVSRARGTA